MLIDISSINLETKKVCNELTNLSPSASTWTLVLSSEKEPNLILWEQPKDSVEMHNTVLASNETHQWLSCYPQHMANTNRHKYSNTPRVRPLIKRATKYSHYVRIRAVPQSLATLAHKDGCNPFTNASTWLIFYL